MVICIVVIYINIECSSDFRLSYAKQKYCHIFHRCWNSVGNLQMLFLECMRNCWNLKKSPKIQKILLISGWTREKRCLAKLRGTNTADHICIYGLFSNITSKYVICLLIVWKIIALRKVDRRKNRQNLGILVRKGRLTIVCSSNKYYSAKI